jgi:hypothetical protein
MNIIDQMSKGYKKLSKKSKMLEQELNEKSNENKELVDELDDLKKSKECKGLEQELKALRKSFDEIQASRECLKEDHKDLEIVHSRLKEAYSALLELVKEKDIMLEKLKKKAVVEQVIVTCDVGLTCDLIDDSFHSPIIVESTNPSCSTSTSTSTISDSFTCDASLIVKNEILKKEVNELNRALGKAYSGEACLLKCLGSQIFSLNKEGLGYTPKKDKAAFATHKPSFVKSNGRFCNRCKQVGHLKHNCNNMNKNKKNANVPYIHFDSSYVLTKGEKGAHAKFVGTPIVGPKKKAIWVSKSLVTNLQGPKQVWVPKKH